MAAMAAMPRPARAEVMTFTLLPSTSRAAFKSDAPLETFTGNTFGDALQGSLTVDPIHPKGARGVVRIDMNAVRTGIDMRDVSMRSKTYLDTDVEANRWVTFEISSIDIAGPLIAGKDIAAKVSGILTVKQKPVVRIADALVTYVALTSEQAAAQRRFGFTGDNIKVRAKFSTTFTDHGMRVPEILIFKLSNELQLETDLTFVRSR